MCTDKIYKGDDDEVSRLVFHAKAQRKTRRKESLICVQFINISDSLRLFSLPFWVKYQLTNQPPTNSPSPYQKTPSVIPMSLYLLLLLSMLLQVRQ